MAQGWKKESQRHDLSRQGIKTSEDIQRTERMALERKWASKVYPKKVLITHLRANNDPNGNPQRLFIVQTADGKTIDIVDEGYHGNGAFNRTYPNYTEIGTYDISKSDYHEYIRESKEFKHGAKW
jgi:hypothetical protein